MKISCSRCREIWLDLVRERFFGKDASAEVIGRRLLRVNFLSGGEFRPGRAAAYAREKHPALTCLYFRRLTEERIRRNGGQMELPL